MTVCGAPPHGKVPMSIQMVLLPVFVQIGLTLALRIGMGRYNSMLIQALAR
jgi:hypothetical protein